MILALLGGLSLSEIAIAVVFVLFLLGIVVIVAQQAKIPIAPWIWQIAGLVLLVVVSIVAIKFVASL